MISNHRARLERSKRPGLTIRILSSTLSLPALPLDHRTGSKAWKDPPSNALTSLFNDIKSTSNYVYFVYNTNFNQNNPHKDPLTLRWEYGLFAQSVIGYLQGFQEQAVGLLVSLNPKDKEGKKAFRAQDFGMTDSEKKLREDHFVRYREAQETAAKIANKATQIVKLEKGPPAIDGPAS